MIEFYNYDQLLDVPEELSKFLSARGLSEDYWQNICQDYDELNARSQQYFNVTPLTLENFQFEIKVEDLAVDHPHVPRYHSKQGLIYLWSVDTSKSLAWLPDSISRYVYEGMDFKLERQSVKSSCPDMSEFCMAQIYLEADYVFVGILKTPNWLQRITAREKREYYKKFWKLIVDSTDKPVIVPSVGFMNRVQKEINNKTIAHEPYHEKVMHHVGFVKKPLGNYPMIRLSPDTEVWVYEH